MTEFRETLRRRLRYLSFVGLFVVGTLTFYNFQNVVYALVQTWDLSTSTDYWCEGTSTACPSTNVEVVNGYAQLIFKQPDHTDSSQANFDAGTYNTSGEGVSEWSTDHVRIAPYTAAAATGFVSATALRDPADPSHADFDTEAIVLLDFDESSGAQVFDDSALGGFPGGGDVYEDDASAGSNASSSGDDPTIYASAVGPNFGNMLQFDGGDRVNLDYSGSSTNTNVNTTFDTGWSDRTVAMWFFAPDVSTRQLLYKEGGGVNGAAIWIENGVVKCGVWTGFGDGSSDMNVATEAPIQADTWHHIFCQHDGSTGYNQYLDGEFIHSPADDEICGVCIFENQVNHSGDDSVCENDGNYFLNGLSTNSNDWCGNGLRLDEFFVINATNPATTPERLYGVADPWYAIWPLNEAAATGTIADSGNWTNNVSTLSSVTQSDSGGQFGGAITVGGTGYFELASDPSIQYYDQFTAMMWINPTSLPGDATTDHLMVVNSDFADITFALRGVGSNAKLYGIVDDGSTSTTVTGKLNITTSGFQHVGMTVNAGEVRFYVDGVLDSVHPYSEDLTGYSGDGVIRVGANLAGSNGFDGLIDDVVMAGRAYSAHEMAEVGGAFPRMATFASRVHDNTSSDEWRRMIWTEDIPYGDEISATASNIQFLWHLNETSGDDVADATSAAFDAATTGTTTIIEGVFGKARYFSGDGEVIESDTTASSLTSYTYELWVRFEDLTPAATETILNVQGRDPAIRRNTNGEIEVIIDNDTATPEITSSFTVTDRRWHHIAITNDAGSLTLYIDGVNAGTGTGTASAGSATVYLGDDGTSSPFDGAIDEFAAYDAALSSGTILNHYRQGANDLKILARSCDDGACSGESWEGTDGSAMLTEPTTVAGHAIHYRFNETTYDGDLDEVVDETTNSNDGRSMYAKSIQSGRFGRAVSFDGRSSYIRVPDTASLEISTSGAGAITIEAWLFMEEGQENNATVVSKQYSNHLVDPAGTAVVSYAMELTDDGRLQFRVGDDSSDAAVTSTTKGLVTVGEWVHVVAEWTGTVVNFYINGVTDGSPVLAKNIDYDWGDLYIGMDKSGTRPGFRGIIDELGIYNVEIGGAQALTNFNLGNPYNFFTNASGETLDNIAAARYFQYKVFFRGNGEIGLNLQDVGLLNNLFATTDPTVETRSAVRLEYVDLSTFTETTGPGNEGSLRYVLREDADANWKYWDGGAWSTSDSSWGEANDAATINTNINRFEDDVSCSDPCYVLWKGLLHSDGVQQVQLDTITIEAPNKVTVTAPIGASGDLTVATDMDVTWSFLGDVTNVDIAYRIGGVGAFNDLVLGADSEAATGGCTDPGARAGCYRLKVPDAIGADFEIRIRETGDATVENIGAVNTVVGDLVIVVPAPPTATEEYVVGDTLTIQWIASGSIGALGDTVINIDTQIAEGAFEAGSLGVINIVNDARNDNNGFACVPPVVQQYQFGGCYEWTITDNITADYDARVRIDDNGEVHESDEFRITGSIELLTPLASDVWKVETANNISDSPIEISWTSQGGLGNLTLHLDDEGTFSGSEREIITTLARTGANGTTCTVPSGGGCYILQTTGEYPQKDETTSGAATAKFRLTAPGPDPDVVSVVGSTAAFEIRPWYDITLPTSATEWLVGDTGQVIQWETHGNGLGNYDFHYRVDTGAWQAISLNVGTDTNDTDATYSIPWNPIPDETCAGPPSGCDKMTVRIQQAGGGIQDISDSFTIKPTVIITDPSPKNFEIGDTTPTLAWTLTGTVPGNVSVFYSTDGNWGNSCVSSTGTGKCSVCTGDADGDTATTGHCDWTTGVPDTPSETVSFRAELEDDSSVFDNSGTSDNVIHGTFTVSTPACAPNCFSEDEAILTWTETTGSVNIPTVDLWYAVDGAAWTKINSSATPNDGLFNDSDSGEGGAWDIPTAIVHDNVQIRVTDAQQTTLHSAGLSAAFDSPVKIRVITPNGGGYLTVGNTYDIGWATQGDLSNTGIDLEYCTDGANCTSTASIASGLHPYTANGTACTIPTVSAPEQAGCFRWEDGATGGVSNLRGTTFRVRASDADVTGAVADCSPSDCSTARPDVPDISDADFSIYPKLTVTYPNAGGIQLDAASPVTVQWNSQGEPLGNVEVLFSPNGGISFPFDVPAGGNPTTNLSSAGGTGNSVGWTTPVFVSSGSISFSIKVQDPDNDNFDDAEDVSDNTFDIVARFDPTAPAGGESWPVYTNQLLSWTSYGAISTIRVEYWNDTIGSWTTIVQDSPIQGETTTDGSGNAGNASQLTWRVPDVANIIDVNTTKFRIIDAVSGHVLRTNPVESSTMNVVANLQVIEPPETGVNWRNAQTRVIRWKQVGTNDPVTDVAIEYDTVDNTFSNAQTIDLTASHGTNADNGGCTLDGGLASNESEGCYAWTISGFSSDDTSVYVRVRDVTAGHPASENASGNGVSSVFSVLEGSTLTLVEPTSNAYNVDDDVDVIWNGTGDMVNDTAELIDIYYSTAASPTYPADYTLWSSGVDADSDVGGCTSTGGTGCIRLKAPDAISGNFRALVVDADDVDVISAMAATNTISGNITINTPAPPAATETYVVGDTLVISWTVFGGSIGIANDTIIEIDTQTGEGAFEAGAAGVTTITTSATNDNNGFSCVPPTVTAPQYGGCYEYPVPDELANADAQIRVREPVGGYASSSDDFTITGRLTLTKPTALDVWKADSALDINDNSIFLEWTYRSDNIGDIAIEFDPTGTFGGSERSVPGTFVRNTNNGTSCVAPSGGGCVVLSGTDVPQASELTAGATTAKWRLTAATPTPNVVSDVPSTPAFEVRGWFDITTPTSSTVWSVASAQDIIWDTHGVGLGNVDVQYKIDAGAWTDIVTNIDDGGNGTGNTYNWPSVVDATCSGIPLGCDKVKIRVRQTGGGGLNILDESDNFTIKPGLTMSDPTPLNFQIGDTSREVEWTVGGTIFSNANVYYSTDQNWGNSCQSSTGAGKCFVCGTLAVATKCTWPSVPDTPSENIKFRIEAAEDTTINDENTSVASIHGAFSTAPAACAPNCFSEDQTNITWTEDTGSSVLAASNVDIYYATDGATWNKINATPTPNDGIFNSADTDANAPWTIPESVIHDNVQLRVVAVSDTLLNSAGDSTAFSTPVKFRMIEPNGGEVLTIGTTFDIEWAYQGSVSNMTLLYCTDGTITCGGTVIASNVVPNTDNGTGCTPPGVSAPESSGCYRWTDATSTGVADIRGTTIRIFAQDAETACAPDACSSARPKVDDGSDANLKAQVDLGIVQPTAGGLKIDADTSYNIQWDSQGSPLSNVEIHYSSNSGGLFPSLIYSGANVTQSAPPASPNNTYAWTTPKTISTGTIKYRIRVRDPDTVNYDLATVMSANDFDIVARFDPTAPAGGESWPVLSNQAITWTTAGTVAQVQLQYFNTAIGTWTTIVQETPTQGETATDGSGNVGNAGTFTWKVPNVANAIDNNTTRIRLIDADSGHVLRDTPVQSNTFNVVANLTLDQPPEGGVNWRATQTRTIYWTQTGDNDSLGNVTLEYDATDNTFAAAQNIAVGINNGANSDNGGCTPQAAGAGEVTGCYAWVIPGGLAGDSDVWVRVKDNEAGHPDSTAVSGNGVSASFPVLAASSITVIEPVGEANDVYDSVPVQWDGSGAITDVGETVDIYYSTAASPTYPADWTIWASAVDADGAVGCTASHLGCVQLNIPDAISSNFRVRVQDADDPDIFNEGGTNTITGKVEIQTPVPSGGPETFVVGDTMTISWISFGSIGAANNTVIEVDTNISSGDFSGAGYTSHTLTATNDNNGFGCIPPTVTAPRFGGCYEITVPDELSNVNARVRVGEDSHQSESDLFTVTGSITITSPTALDVWKVETDKDINDLDIAVEWTYTGTIGNVFIDFDRDGDFDGGDAGFDLHVTDITGGGVAANNDPAGCTAPVGGGCYVWSAGPDADRLGTGAKFRIRATTPEPDVETNVGSTPAFEVRGWYEVTAPTSSDTWLVQETTNDIVWETHGNGLGNIDISYKVDTGSWIDIITNVVDSDGDANTYTWPSVVDAVCGSSLGCNKVKIRVKQTGVGTIADQSDDFTIKPRVIITDPSPSNFQIADTTRTVAWQLRGTVSGNVNVFYSTDQNWGNACVASTGTGKCSVCSDTAAGLTCTWAAVPDTPSETVVFRAEAANDTTITSDSTGFESIHGSFTANVPACAPNCFSEDTTNLTWSEDTGSVNIANVNIYWSTDGAAWNQINATPTPNDGIFNSADTDANAPWVIPETIVHDAVQIRVVDINDSLNDSEGISAAFSVPARLRMITPNGGENWVIGADEEIQWAYTGTIANVSLEYCENGTASCGGSENVIVASVAANNTTGCTPPTPGPNETVGCYDWNDATTGGVANTRGVQIRAYVSDEDTACGPDACSSARPKIDDAADANSKIMVSLAMAAPLPNAELDAGTNYAIQWNSQADPTFNAVDLVLSDDGGSTYGTNIQLGEGNTSVAGSQTLNTYSGTFTTPLLITDSGAGRDYFIRVRDPDTTNYIEAESNVNVDVVAKFTVLNPTGASNLLVGRNYTLSWTTLGAVNNVKLAYTTPEAPISGAFQDIIQTGGEGGTPVPTATDGNNEAPNTGTFVWQVPDVAGIISTGAEIRLIDGDDTHVLRTTPDTSATFDILPGFEVINPAGSEILNAGDTLTIQWKTLATNSAPSNVDIEFSTNGGSTWTGTVVTDAVNGQNSGCTLPSVGAGETAACYDWKMPGTAVGGNIKVRVKDSDTGAPDSTQDATNGVSEAFQIQDAIFIVQPVLDDQITVGTSYDIQWEVYGTFANVDLQYSDDDFSSDSTDILLNAGHDQNGSGCTLTTPAAGGTAGCYRWNPVPNDVRPDLKLRLKEISGAERETITGTWEIVGPLAIAAPAGGPTTAFDVGDTVNIQWTNNQSLPIESPVDLEYSTTGPTGPWTSIATSIPNSGLGGNRDWTVPDSISDNVYVRVIRTGQATIGDVSNDSFDITGKIELSTLQGADDQYAIGDTVPITFDVTGTATGSFFANVTVRYSTDSTFQTGVVNSTTGFALDHNGAQTNCTGGSAPYTCTFNWTVADSHEIVASEVYYLQVVDANQLIGANTSPFQFQLYGDLELSAEHPCGVDNVCFVSETPNIVFTKEGLANGSLFDFVNIQYSDDGFANNVVTIESNWALDATNCPAGTCTYNWNINDTNTLSSSNTYFLRVIDPDNTISTDVGTTGFEIAGNLALTMLDSGDQIFKVGETIPVTFNKAGSANGSIFDDVVIQYSDQSDFSSNVTNIDTSFALNAGNCPANACTFNWLIDDTDVISNTAVYYLRAYDPDNVDSTTGASTDQFEIRGDLVLTILTAGNQTYKVGDTVAVNFQKDGSPNGSIFDDVTIEYSDDGFGVSTYNIVTADLSTMCSGSFPNETCTYNWVLDNADPIITGQNYTMRIIDPNNADSVTTSTRQFKIAGDLALTILTGSDDTYNIGEQVTVTWTAEGAANGTVFDNVDVLYSDDNFSSNIITIADDLGLSAACVGINCSYDWTIPSSAVITSTAAYKFRVVDEDNATDSVSTSSNRFRLAGYLNLTTQGANATYSVGQAVPITFDVDGAAQGTLFNDVHIQYSDDEFATDNRAIALNQDLSSVAAPFVCGAGSCTYTWTIPNTVTLTSGFDYRLRVIDPDNTDLSTYGITLSAAHFKLAGGFTWNSPTGAEVWGVASDQSVDWDTSGAINNVKVSYSTDDFTNETFFDVVSTKLQAGVATTFGAASSITNTANGNTAFTMVIPDGISTNFKLRVYDANDSAVYVDSPAIKVHAVYTVTEPGVNTKIANTLYTNGIQWSTAGSVTNSILQYQLDGGSWTAIPAAESAGVTDSDGITAGNPGVINWTTPSAKAAATKVRVCAPNGAVPDTDTCTESSTFKLSAKVSVVTPNGEQAPFWRVGETSHDITWTTVPANLGNNVVDILYSTQGLGGVFNSIVSGTANDGTHTWNPIPDTVSDNVYIRIVDSNDASGKDESDASFSIAGDLQIEAGNSDAPLGGELWPVYKAIPAALANAQDIIWTSTGTAMNQVDIRASNDDFGASDVLIASGVVNLVGQNTYTWQISDSVAPITPIGNGTWKIKVVNSAPGTPAEEVISNAFSISAGMYMSSHNTLADRCLIGNVCTINWDTAGNVSDVILEYSTNGDSGPWSLMHGGATLGSNPGFINWTVPGGLTPQIDIRYRVTDGVGGHPAVTDMTDIDTRIVAEFPSASVLLSPSGQPLSGRTFSVGESIAVSYTYTSTVDNVDIQYTLDDDNDPLTFDNPVTIISDDPTNGDGTGVFNYTFGDLMTGGADVTRIQFRVLDSAVPDDDVTNTVNGVTGAFKLRGDITVTAPNDGTEKWAVGSNQTISWTHTGASITNVTIEYDDNSAFTSPTFLTTGTPSTPGVGGSFNIDINDTNFPDLNVLYHNDIFIRVSDADTSIHGNSNDKSDNGHMIVGVIDFTVPAHAPTVGENWSLGLPHTITWNTQGQITSVDIYYSNDGTFGSATLINSQITSGECNPGPSCTNTPDADNSVSWTPPTSSNVGVNSAIFVVDTEDNSTPQTPTFQLMGQSPIFNLHGSVSYTGTLLDGQKLKAGNIVNITWDTFGDALNNLDIEYSTDDDLNLGTFDNPQAVALNFDNSTGGGSRGTYNWTIPTTFNDDTVYLRINPAGSSAGEDVSGAFKIMPNIQITSPVNLDEWEVGSNQDISWNIVGTVSNITLRYSVDNGTSYPVGSPYEIITLDPNVGGYALTGANARYTWTVEDTITQLGKMKIQLDDDPSEDADAEMAGVFTIESLFILNSPSANDEYEVGGTFTGLNWDWSGTIPNIAIEISNTYDGVDPATFDTGARCLDLTNPPCTGGGQLLANGVGSGGTGYSPAPVAVPDWISRPGDTEGEFPFYLRISDPNNTNTWSIAPTGGTGFKIKSNIGVTAPAGAENWFVGNSDHDITWTHTGTVSNVILEYSDDNFSSNIYCVNGGTYPSCNSTSNANTYTWNIPDDETLVAYTCNTDTDSNPGDQIHPCMNTTVRVRVRDAGDTAVLDTSAADFTARYVAKEWKLRDSVSGADLNSITMFDNSIHRIRAYSNQSVLGIVSPYTIWSPSGTNYSIGFSKTGYNDFTDSAQTTALADAFTGVGEHFKDEEQELFLQSTVAHNDIINTSYSYTPSLSGANDSITFKVWYTRDGINVATSTQANLRIYDSANTEIYNLVSATQNPAGTGVYTFTISPTSLSLGQNYTARNRITLASTTELEGYTVINLTETANDQFINANTDTITPLIQTNLDAQLSTQFTTLETAVTDLDTEITTKIGDTSSETLVETIDATRNRIQTSLDNFKTKSTDTINRMKDRIEEASIRLIIPDTVKLGSDETLRLSTANNVTPTMTLLCPDGSTIFDSLAMTEGEPGIYGVDVEFNTLNFNCAAAKAVTVIATAVIPSNDPGDPAFTATAIGSIFLTTTDLDTIQGLAAAGLNAEKAAKDAKDAANNLGAALNGDGSVSDAISELQKTVNRIPSLISSNQGGMSQMKTTLNEVSNRLNVFLGNEGVDLRSVLKEEIGDNVKGIRNKMDRTLATTEVIKEIIERKVGKSEEPIIQTFFEIGSVKLRVIAVNPSEDKSQIVPIKIYLPKEVIPDDVIDMGELSLGYDSGKGLYYAFNDKIELAAKESRIFEVHLEDVWRFPDEEIDGLKKQSDLALKHLENSDFYEQAKGIVETIHTRLDEIKTKQNDTSVSREEHMGAFRVNQVVMAQIKRDIELIEKMLQFVGAPPSVEFLTEPVESESESPNKIKAWYLIFGVLGFIGILALGFYVRWLMVIKAPKRTPIVGSHTVDEDAAPFVGENVEGSDAGSKGGSIPIGDSTPEEDEDKKIG